MLAHISKHTVGDFVIDENVCLHLDPKKTIKCGGLVGVLWSSKDIWVWTLLSDTAAVAPQENQGKLNTAKIICTGTIKPKS